MLHIIDSNFESLAAAVPSLPVSIPPSIVLVICTSPTLTPGCTQLLLDAATFDNVSMEFVVQVIDVSLSPSSNGTINVPSLFLTAIFSRTVTLLLNSCL